MATADDATRGTGADQNAASMAGVAVDSPAQELGQEIALQGSPAASTSRKSSSRARRKPHDLSSSPLGLKQIFLTPEVGPDGFPVWRPTRRSPASQGDWNARFHLNGTENELLPKRLRRYFSVPSELHQLKNELASGDFPRGVNQPQDILKKLRLPDLPQPPRSPLTADTGAPLCPGRYVPGGSMTDKEGKPTPWNDKFHFGTALEAQPFQRETPQQLSQRSARGSGQSKWRRAGAAEQEASRAWKPSTGSKAARPSLTGSNGTYGSEP